MALLKLRAINPVPQRPADAVARRAGRGRTAICSLSSISATTLRISTLSCTAVWLRPARNSQSTPSGPPSTSALDTLDRRNACITQDTRSVSAHPTLVALRQRRAGAGCRKTCAYRSLRTNSADAPATRASGQAAHTTCAVVSRRCPPRLATVRCTHDAREEACGHLLKEEEVVRVLWDGHHVDVASEMHRTRRHRTRRGQAYDRPVRCEQALRPTLARPESLRAGMVCCVRPRLSNGAERVAHRSKSRSSCETDGALCSTSQIAQVLGRLATKASGERPPRSIRVAQDERGSRGSAWMCGYACQLTCHRLRGLFAWRC
eukprot:3540017-Pleurochrysis_carterae.AAC.2